MHLDTDLKTVFQERGPSQNQKVLKFFKQRDDDIVNVVNETIKTDEFSQKYDITEQVQGLVISIYDYMRKNQKELMKYFLKIKNLQDFQNNQFHAEN